MKYMLSINGKRFEFDPVKDSIKMYKLFGRKFIHFVFSPLSSCIIDLLLFYILCNAFYGILEGYTILFSTIFVRCISAVYNYLINYKLVFDSNGKHIDLGTKYFGLAVVQMWMSGMLVTFFAQLWYSVDKVIIKIFVDGFLLLISFRYSKNLSLGELHQTINRVCERK